ncbi:site-specific integrase [uncultured Sphingorhabdus sp.]|uniref:tyrosine-type recombinase/integrase n=1 Tax=uncultured Sphingorhabdus sp. TaxID=1686106 RepID=UPI00262845C9|nr:site-specific integrase [uncultured Sphingorhabdus sp.]
MPTLKANHRQILAAKPVDGKKTRYRIEGVPGLWLYVSPSGVRTWYARYQIGSGKTRRERWYRIGDATSTPLATATERAKSVDVEVDVKERDPHGGREFRGADEMTVGDLFHEWHTRYATLKLARAPTDEITFRCHIKPEFAKRKVRELTRLDLGRFRDVVAKKATPLTSNRVMVLLSRIFNWGLDEGMLEFNPVARMRKAAARKPRERVLTRVNINVFWNALDHMETMTVEHMARAEKGRILSPSTRSILRLLLLTGQRRTEVVGALKSELELHGPEPVWTIPGERTKNGLLHRVPLCPNACEEFVRAIVAAPAKSPYVFASADNPRAHLTPLSITRAMARLVNELKIPTVSPHDLRRTVGTEMARLGIAVHVRSLVLNHSPQSRGITEAVYNRYAYDKEKREALALWEAELMRLIGSAASARAAALS